LVRASPATADAKVDVTGASVEIRLVDKPES
jgi:hypothetical protein